MSRSPRSMRPRSGRLDRSRPAGVPATAPHESSSRLLFTARLLPGSTAASPDEGETTADVAAPEDGEATAPGVVAQTPAPSLPPPTTHAAGPATRVHAERLSARSPRLQLTPSQAVRLASDGRDVLTRPRPKAS